MLLKLSVNLADAVNKKQDGVGGAVHIINASWLRFTGHPSYCVSKSSQLQLMIAGLFLMKLMKCGRPICCSDVTNSDNN